MQWNRRELLMGFGWLGLAACGARHQGLPRPSHRLSEQAARVPTEANVVIVGSGYGASICAAQRPHQLGVGELQRL